jgi:TIR domain/HEAT repeats/NACHT domain
LSGNSLIFLSYARTDGGDAVAHLEEELGRRGYPTWRDTRSIDPTADFTAQIETAIDQCSHIVVCVTPDVKRPDSFVRREVHYASILKKPITPALFANVPPPIMIVTLEWVDFFNNRQRAMDRLLEILERPRRTMTAGSHSDPFRAYLDSCYKQLVKELQWDIGTLIIPRIRDVSFEYLGKRASTGARLEEAHSVQQRQARSLFDAFSTYDQRMLLLGPAGSGKTVALRALARDAVTQRLDEPTAPLPLVASIASWDAEKQPELAAWLTSSQPLLAESEVRETLEQGRALLFLDGLDELGPPRRYKDGSIVDPQQDFLGRLPRQNGILLTTRAEESHLPTALDAFHGAVGMAPITQDDQFKYLQQTPVLFETVRRHRVLQDALTLPLMLHHFAWALEDAPSRLRKLEDDAGPRIIHEHIIELYIERAYGRYQREHGRLVTLEELYTLLGGVAMRDAGGGGNQNIFPPEEFGGRSETRSKGLIEFACDLGLLRRVGGSLLRFSHLLIRDHFAVREAIRVLSAGPAASDATTRDRAAWALWEIPDGRAVAVLLAALQDEDRHVRGSAASALGRIGDPQAVRPLIELTNDTTPVRSIYGERICDVARSALMSIGTPEAVAAAAEGR